MRTEEYIALGGLITICASALALVIKQIEGSRCSKVKCCGVECDRTVPPVLPVVVPSTPSVP